MANVKKIKRRRTKRKSIDDVFYKETSPSLMVFDNYRYTCYFDGACDANPSGNIGYGYVVYENNRVIDDYSRGVSARRGNSSNVAEYLAFQELVVYLLDVVTHTDNVVIYGDSMLVVMQMLGKWKIKDGLYLKYAVEAKKMFNELKKQCHVELRWINRERNEYADSLSKDGLNSVL